MINAIKFLKNIDLNNSKQLIELNQKVEEIENNYYDIKEMEEIDSFMDIIELIQKIKNKIKIQLIEKK